MIAALSLALFAAGLALVIYSFTVPAGALRNRLVYGSGALAGIGLSLMIAAAQ